VVIFGDRRCKGCAPRKEYGKMKIQILARLAILGLTLLPIGARAVEPLSCPGMIAAWATGVYNAELGRYAAEIKYAMREIDQKYILAGQESAMGRLSKDGENTLVVLVLHYCRENPTVSIQTNIAEVYDGQRGLLDVGKTPESRKALCELGLLKGEDCRIGGVIIHELLNKK
jgi:hypothetical protein